MDDNDEFTNALIEEMGGDPPVEDASPTEDIEEQAEDAPEESDNTPEESAPPTEEVDKPQESSDAEDEPEEQAEVPQSPQFATKADVLDAMREFSQSQSQRTDTINSRKQEIIDSLHPEGIDRKLYDSDGREIRTAQDIVDRGLVKANGEEFTYEEAAQWILDSQRQMAENYANIEKEAEGFAELETSLVESSNRVMEVYGDILDALPNIKQQLAGLYAKTLVVDPKTNIITKATVDPMEFYSTYLAPYTQLGEQVARNKELEALAKQQEAETERDERMGLPNKGTSKAKANTGDEFVDALIDEMEAM